MVCGMQQKLRKDSKKRHKRLRILSRILSMLLPLICISSMVYANSTVYEQWKKRQQQHDLRLSQKYHQGSVVVPSYPLGVQPRIATTPIQNSINSSPRLGEQVKVNLNTATAQELSAKLEGIGAKKAQAIVAYRSKQGGFKHIQELKNVKGIGEKIYTRNVSKLKLND